MAMNGEAGDLPRRETTAPGAAPGEGPERSGVADPARSGQAEERGEGDIARDVFELADEEGADERLPCGRLLSEVWDAADRGVTDPHQRSCPHCTAARAELGSLGEAVREAIEDEGPDEVARWDASELAERVMDVVRLELRPGRTLPIGAVDEDLWIVEAAAAKTVRSAVDTVPGVRAGSCRVGPADPAGPTHEVGHAEEEQRHPTENARGPRAVGTHVQLEVVVSETVPLWEIADSIRARVRSAMHHELGMEVASVDVRVTDIDAGDEGEEEIAMSARVAERDESGAEHRGGVR